MIYYAMYKGKGVIGNALIRWWKKSEYSHCELVIDDICYSSSAMDGGVRSKEINVHTDDWTLIPIDWVDKEKVLAYFNKTKGQHYSWVSVFTSQFFAREVDEPKASFCSEWCADALELPAPIIYSPESLGYLCEYLNKKLVGEK